MRGISRAAVVLAGSTVFVFVGGGSVWTATTTGSPGGDPGPQVTRAELDRAGRAALEATGGRRVTECARGRNPGEFDVEVAVDGGRRLDVRLDESFAVVAITPDGD
jgi:hypothetical protein